MTAQRRTPRAHLGMNVIGTDTDQDAIPVSPALVDYLEQAFPIRLSPLDQHPGIITDQARQTGQQDVIDLIRKLSQPTEA